MRRRLREPVSGLTHLVGGLLALVALGAGPVPGAVRVVVASAVLKLSRARLHLPLALAAHKTP
jgi:hypothetical protein